MGSTIWENQVHYLFPGHTYKNLMIKIYRLLLMKQHVFSFFYIFGLCMVCLYSKKWGKPHCNDCDHFIQEKIIFCLLIMVFGHINSSVDHRVNPKSRPWLLCEHSLKIQTLEQLELSSLMIFH